MRSLPVLTIIICLMFGGQTWAQEINVAFDTLMIRKPKARQLYYEFDDKLLSRARINTKAPKRSPYKPDEAVTNMAGDAIIIFLGGFLSSTSSKDLTWTLGADLNTNNDNLNWQVALFCPGELLKEKERVENQDGSFSVVNNKIAVLNWREGSTGVIIENQDTIAKFMIVLNPRGDSTIQRYFTMVFNDDERLPIRTASRNPVYLDYINHSLTEYAIVGNFRGLPFVAIENGHARKVWFFQGDEQVFIFIPDLDDLMLKKADRVMPYLILRKKLGTRELTDALRMTLVTRYLGNILANTELPY